tara:strand:+ start:6198 stop:6452 length:255 start_codon:yes stop_codon:yes gene_type:complete
MKSARYGQNFEVYFCDRKSCNLMLFKSFGRVEKKFELREIFIRFLRLTHGFRSIRSTPLREQELKFIPTFESDVFRKYFLRNIQ